MKTDALVERLVNSYGNWVQKDCENTEGGTGRYTRELWPYDTMFSPIQVNRLTIKNRLVMAPMGNCQITAYKPCPVDCKDDMQILYAHIVKYLVKRPL